LTLERDADEVHFVHATFLILALAHWCRGDTFGSGANTFDIEFVTIGNPGNPGDSTVYPNSAGSVPYTYRIGKYEISEDQPQGGFKPTAIESWP
jgi:hypothetical protein